MSMSNKQNDLSNLLAIEYQHGRLFELTKQARMIEDRISHIYSNIKDTMDSLDNSEVKECLEHVNSAAIRLDSAVSLLSSSERGFDLAKRIATKKLTNN